MEIKGKVHCFFEQSGTFKNEFRKLGYEAYDYDIQNEFQETDFVIDLFKEIENAYSGGGSIFDNITPDDLILAFFPCIYFCEASQSYFMLTNNNYSKLSDFEKIEKIIARNKKRGIFFELLNKMIGICFLKGFRIVFENPWTQPHFLTNAFLKKPDIVDNDRTLRGDFFRKPTAYWFFNCKPTKMFTMQQDKDVMRVWDAGRGNAGTCSKERSLISHDYARNFICDFILGKPQPDIDPKLFY